MAEDPLPLPAPTRELVRLVELDYERTGKVIEGVIGTAATTRGLLLTAWGVVLALAFDTGQWTLAAAGFAIVVVAALLDAYHSWVYNEALGQAVKLEGLSQLYNEALSQGADEAGAKTALEAALSSHNFGVYRNLKEFSFKKLRGPVSERKEFWQSFRPKVFYQVLYPGLLLVSIVVAAVLASTASTQKCYNIKVQATPTASANASTPPVTVLAPGEVVSACAAQGR